MNTWDTQEGVLLVDRVISLFREAKRLEPGLGIPGDPVDLHGMCFPTIRICELLALPQVVASRVVGRQEFRRAALKRVDLSGASLEFSTWHECSFENVAFDSGNLSSARFFGCRFRRCSFQSVNLRDSSFSVGQGGLETEIRDSEFKGCDFSGASCESPVFRNVRFITCQLAGFVFQSPLCDHITFAGEYPELLFRGRPGDVQRNRLELDLCSARITWLDADGGLDLRSVLLPGDGSCFVVVDRIPAVRSIVASLESDGNAISKQVAGYLKAIYSEQSISPKDADQTMFLVSKAMVRELVGTDGKQVAEEMFFRIREIVAKSGFLAISGDR